MPKMKTRKAAAKRFKVTGTGKIVHRSIGLNHLMRKKTKAGRRRLTKGDVMTGGVMKRAEQMLGI